MAHTLRERAEKTRQYIADPDVGVVEAFVHLYLWTRFEWTMQQLKRHHRNGEKLMKKLNNNLDVVKLRKDLNQWGS